MNCDLKNSIREWGEKEMEEIATINPPKPKDRDKNEDVSFVSMSNVDGDSGSITNQDEVKLGEVVNGHTAFKNHDVIFAKITPCMENGKCAIVDNLINGVGFGSTEFYVIRPFKDVAPNWIYYFLRQESIRKLAKQSFTGSSGHKRVSKKFIEKVSIPLPIKNGKPDLEKQRRIIKKIDKLFIKIDEAIAKTEKNLKTARKLLNNALYQAFNKGKGKWRTFSLVDLTEGMRAGGTPNTRRKDFWNGNISFSRISDLTSVDKYLKKTKNKISTQGLKNSSSWLLPGNSLIFSMYGTVGKAVINKTPVAITQNMAGIIPDKKSVLLNFLYYALKFVEINGLQNYLKFSVHQHFGITEAKKIKIEVPFKDNKPDLKAQQKIVNHLDKVQELSKKLEKQLELQLNNLNTLKQSILQQAFSGKL